MIPDLEITVPSATDSRIPQIHVFTNLIDSTDSQMMILGRELELGEVSRLAPSLDRIRALVKTEGLNWTAHG